MNNQDKINNNKNEDIKNNLNEQFDLNNILTGKNDEDNEEEDDK